MTSRRIVCIAKRTLLGACSRVRVRSQFRNIGSVNDREALFLNYTVSKFVGHGALSLCLMEALRLILWIDEDCM